MKKQLLKDLHDIVARYWVKLTGVFKTENIPTKQITAQYHQQKS